MPISVLLADDHCIVRQSLKALLERHDFRVVGEAPDGYEAIRQAAESCPDVAVIDIGMPTLNGLDAARRIRKICPRTRIVVLTMYTESHYVLEALRCGVNGYVVKSQAVDDLIQAVHEALKGRVYLSPSISRTIVDAYLAGSQPNPDPLTPREREVLQLVAEGNTTKEIATQLEISVKTAECHRTRIMEKLDIHDTARLVRYALQHGLAA